MLHARERLPIAAAQWSTNPRNRRTARSWSATQRTATGCEVFLSPTIRPPGTAVPRIKRTQPLKKPKAPPRSPASAHRPAGLPRDTADKKSRPWAGRNRAPRYARTRAYRSAPKFPAAHNADRAARVNFQLVRYCEPALDRDAETARLPPPSPNRTHAMLRLPPSRSASLAGMRASATFLNCSARPCWHSGSPRGQSTLAGLGPAGIVKSFVAAEKVCPHAGTHRILRSHHQ